MNTTSGVPTSEYRYSVKLTLAKMWIHSWLQAQYLQKQVPNRSLLIYTHPPNDTYIVYAYPAHRPSAYMPHINITFLRLPITQAFCVYASHRYNMPNYYFPSHTGHSPWSPGPIHVPSTALFSTLYTYILLQWLACFTLKQSSIHI